MRPFERSRSMLRTRSRCSRGRNASTFDGVQAVKLSRRCGNASAGRRSLFGPPPYMGDMGTEQDGKDSLGGRRPLATPDEVATFLRKPRKTLYNWHSLGKGPKALKVGRDLRYRWGDVEEWLDSEAS